MQMSYHMSLHFSRLLKYAFFVSSTIHTYKISIKKNPLIVLNVQYNEHQDVRVDFKAEGLF